MLMSNQKSNNLQKMTPILSLLRRLLSALTPDSPPLPAQAPGPVQPDNILLHFGHTPTLDYYWLGRSPDMTCKDTQRLRPEDNPLPPRSNLVIIRHISRPWQSYLRKNAASFASITYFLDDDIPAILDDSHLPPAYALKTWLRYQRMLPALRRICTHILVSTPALAQKYSLAPESVLEPIYVPAPRPKPDPILVFYHGTEAHTREIRWLRHVLELVQAECSDCLFELSGPAWVKKLYQGLPGVRVIHPLDWKAFLAYTSQVSMHIGLAPVLDSSFNRSRSHVKFFDITRSGAVGIYSRVPQFQRIIRHEHHGLLVENEPRAWAQAILRLARSPELRAGLYHNALQSVQHSDMNHQQCSMD